MHLTIGSSNDNYSTIHRSSTGDHVLDVIGVPRTIDVRVMTVIGFIFDMSSRDSNTTGPFFWGLINRGIVMETGLSFCSEDLGDGSSQSSLSFCQYFRSNSGNDKTNCGANLSVIDMSNGTWVKVNYSNSS